jgi:hypothetical protein
MKTKIKYLIISVALTAIVSCRPTQNDTVPIPRDSVGVVSTFVSAKALQLDERAANVIAMAVDSAGNLYAADQANNRVLKITPSGAIGTLAGTGKAGYVDGPGVSAQFEALVSLAINKQGIVYAGEGYPNTCIRQITPDGQVSTFAGKPFDARLLASVPNLSADGLHDKALFITPISLVFDTAGDLLVSDIGSVNRYASNAVRRITADGDVRTIAGFVTGMPYQGRVVDGSASPYRFIVLAINKANAVIGIENSGYRIYQIGRNGDMSVPTQPRLPRPDALLYDRDGRLMLASGSKIMQLQASSLLTTISGSDNTGFVNDSLRNARFGYISALALDRNNILYIADMGNQCIRRVRLTL